MNKIISLIIFLAFAMSTMAQKELKIGDIFEGKAVSIKDKVETHVKGKTLEPYKLSVLRTIKFSTTANDRDIAERLFSIDMKQVDASTKENFEMESRDGHLYYAVVQISDYQGQRRFICYQCKRTGDEYKITLAYMRGKATINELRKMFKKSK